MTVIRSTSPHAPGDSIAEALELDATHVAAAARRARAAQRGWAAEPAASRAGALAEVARALEARRGEAVDMVVREVGKPRGEAIAEVARAVSILDYYAQAAYAPIGQMFPSSGAAGLLYTARRPRGLAGLITPWNFPLAIPLWKAAPALATGNATILKPSPEALGCALLLADVLDAALPKDLFTVAPGGALTGTALVACADVVSFTGSVRVGREVAAAAGARGVPVQCEMGGQNAAVVLADADPETTAATIASAAMGYAGQKCTATRRAVVVGDNEAFVEALVATVGSLRPSDPATEGAVVGPVITADARHRVLEAVQSGRDGGGTLLAGGGVPDAEGWYVDPTVLSGLPVGHPVMQDETFGPLVAIHRAADLDEAMAIANGVPFGLVTSIHGRDVDALLDAAALADTGMVKVNAPTTGVDFYAPFGGEKQSSRGPREQGTAALDFYTSSRTVTFAPHGS